LHCDAYRLVTFSCNVLTDRLFNEWFNELGVGYFGTPALYRTERSAYQEYSPLMRTCYGTVRIENGETSLFSKLHVQT